MSVCVSVCARVFVKNRESSYARAGLSPVIMGCHFLQRVLLHRLHNPGLACRGVQMAKTPNLVFM